MRSLDFAPLRSASLEMTHFLRLLVMPSEVEASHSQLSGTGCFHLNGPQQRLFAGILSMSPKRTGDSPGSLAKLGGLARILHAVGSPSVKKSISSPHALISKLPCRDPWSIRTHVPANPIYPTQYLSFFMKYAG